MVDVTGSGALKNILEEIELLIRTTDPLPENRTGVCLALIHTARALAHDLVGTGTDHSVLRVDAAYNRFQ